MLFRRRRRAALAREAALRAEVRELRREVELTRLVAAERLHTIHALQAERPDRDAPL